jgi:hypothetical protein
LETTENIGLNTLTAPNGRESRLGINHYTVARTNEFKEWFGDWESLAKAKTLACTITGIHINFFRGNEQRVLFEIAQQVNTGEQARASFTKRFSPELIDIALVLFPEANLGEAYSAVVTRPLDENDEPLVQYVEEFISTSSLK